MCAGRETRSTQRDPRSNKSIGPGEDDGARCREREDEAIPPGSQKPRPDRGPGIILLPGEGRNFCGGIQPGSPEIYLILARREAPTNLRIARWNSCGFPPGYCDNLMAGRQAGKFGAMVSAIRTRTDKSNGQRSLARGLVGLFR